MLNQYQSFKILTFFVISIVNIYWMHSINIEHITNVTDVNCGGNFYDSGGINDNYSNNENITTTICPDIAGEVVTVSFTSFEIENNYDRLKVYDGDTANNLIGEYTGTNSPEIVSATIANGGCLTFVFTSDFSITKPGWEASVYCSLPPTCIPPSEFNVSGVTENSALLFVSDANSPQATTWKIEYGLAGFPQGSGTIITTMSNNPIISDLTSETLYDAYVRAICDTNDFSLWSAPITFSTMAPLPLCGDDFYDSGGIAFNYYNNENIETTICPENAGEVVSVSFTSFEIENNFDKLKIYDGDTANNLIGEYTGTNSPGIVYATIENGGCLTFVFTSDFSVTKPGWEATVYCSVPPSCYSPFDFIVDNVTGSSVSLFIEDVNTPQATSWEIEYGPIGFEIGTGVIYTATTDFFTITGLSLNTSYDAYVRAICDVDDVSIWNPKVSFTTTGVASIDDLSMKSFIVYPNPVSDTVTVQFENLVSAINIKIINIQGQKVYDKNTTSNINLIDVSNFSKGVYFINIQTANQIYTKKLIVN